MRKFTFSLLVGMLMGVCAFAQSGKTVICHNGQTIEVSNNALQTLLDNITAHESTIGHISLANVSFMSEQYSFYSAHIRLVHKRTHENLKEEDSNLDNCTLPEWNTFDW